MLRMRTYLLVVLFFSLYQSCSEAKFNGEASEGALAVDPALDVSENQDRSNNPVPGGTLPNGQDPDLKDPSSPINNARKEVMTFRCDGERDASIGEIAFTGKPDERIHAQIRGEFCPSATQKLNVLFIVDFSASMGKWRKTTKDKWVDGNDLQADGSCGRLKAAEAVMKKLDANLLKGDRIQMATIAFAGDIVDKGKYTDKAFVNANDYKFNLTPERFCKFVAQSNETEAQATGAIAPSNGFVGLGQLNGHTNYQAAFDRASNLLAGVDGRTVVYFISDGAPTLPEVSTIEASTVAGEKMRSASGNITVNALMLGAKNAEAENVLKKVTGSNRIVYAANANELDDKILSFPEATIDTNTVMANLEVKPYPSKELGILNVARTHKAIWTYHTQPFVLLGRPGETVDNVLKVSAKGQDGSVMTSVITVKYTQN